MAVSPTGKCREMHCTIRETHCAIRDIVQSGKCIAQSGKCIVQSGKHIAHWLLNVTSSVIGPGHNLSQSQPSISAWFPKSIFFPGTPYSPTLPVGESLGPGHTKSTCSHNHSCEKILLDENEPRCTVHIRSFSPEQHLASHKNN